MEHETLMQREIRKFPPRPLPIALAQELANTPVTKVERVALLERIYMTLSPADRLRFRDELHACRLAKLGRAEAMVA